ncbi:MAG: hypothetical protein HYY18_12725 [Planctomycetes bacterium]|nr:hypothetical protein [Planctomycetota bacterium]
MSGDRAEFEKFLGLSEVLTGFTKFRLQGTGQGALYFSTLTDVVGQGTAGELLQAWSGVAAAAGQDEGKLERLMRSEILSHEKLGPIARNLIKLWFVGTWYQLPAAWREVFGTPERDRSFVPAASSYVEGLLWPTIGANPTGAKGPGYGTWADPPNIPKV